MYRSASGRVLMSPGSLLLGQQGAGFCCSHEHGKGDRCVAFYFENVWIEKFADELPGVKSIRITCHRVPPAQVFAPLLSDIRILANGKDPDAGEELALRMAGTALRFACGGQDVKGSSPRDEQRVTEAVRIIESRLTEPLSISSLASAVDMSRYHFLRTFQRVTGETPWRYILSLRLALAAENLLTTSGRVLDVALASGFGDLSEFMRRFRLRFGVTPAEYRKRRAHRCALANPIPPPDDSINEAELQVRKSS
jgi:AraC family transcriptional regulator